jgi:prolipoprotein diacylglyceryl transferase
MARLPRSAVVTAVAALGVISLLIGLRKKISDQTTTGVIFLLMAGVLAMFLGERVELRYYSLLFVVVFLGGHALLNWQVKRGGGSSDVANDFIVYGVLGVLVGARLGHVLFYDLEKALQDPWWVFQIWTGGLASHGAVIGLIIAMYLFTKRRGVPFLEGADRFAFSAALGATVVRIGNLMNSEIVGRKVPDQSWGMRFPRFDQDVAEAPLRYPSQIYEILLGVFTFLGLLIADRAMGKEKRPRGALISWFFVLYFTGRLFTERYKEIEALAPDAPITMGQYLSMPGTVIGLVGLWWSYKRREPAQWEERGAGDEDSDGEDEERTDDVDEVDDEETEARRRAAKDANKRRKKRKKAAIAGAAGEPDAVRDAAGGGEDEPGHADASDEQTAAAADDKAAEASDEEADDEARVEAPKTSGDPDVDAEFEGGKLKKRRDP